MLKVARYLILNYFDLRSWVQKRHGAEALVEPSVEVKSACGQRETQVSEDESFIRYVGY